MTLSPRYVRLPGSSADEGRRSTDPNPPKKQPQPAVQAFRPEPRPPRPPAGIGPFVQAIKTDDGLSKTLEDLSATDRDISKPASILAAGQLTIGDLNAALDRSQAIGVHSPIAYTKAILKNLNGQSSQVRPEPPADPLPPTLPAATTSSDDQHDATAQHRAALLEKIASDVSIQQLLEAFKATDRDQQDLLEDCLATSQDETHLKTALLAAKAYHADVPIAYARSILKHKSNPTSCEILESAQSARFEIDKKERAKERVRQNHILDTIDGIENHLARPDYHRARLLAQQMGLNPGMLSGMLVGHPLPSPCHLHRMLGNVHQRCPEKPVYHIIPALLCELDREASSSPQLNTPSKESA